MRVNLNFCLGLLLLWSSPLSVACQSIEVAPNGVVNARASKKVRQVVQVLGDRIYRVVPLSGTPHSLIEDRLGILYLEDSLSEHPYLDVSILTEKGHQFVLHLKKGASFEAPILIHPKSTPSRSPKANTARALKKKPLIEDRPAPAGYRCWDTPHSPIVRYKNYALQSMQQCTGAHPLVVYRISARLKTPLYLKERWFKKSTVHAQQFSSQILIPGKSVFLYQVLSKKVDRYEK